MLTCLTCFLEFIILIIYHTDGDFLLVCSSGTFGYCTTVTFWQIVCTYLSWTAECCNEYSLAYRLTICAVEWCYGISEAPRCVFAVTSASVRREMEASLLRLWHNSKFWNRSFSQIWKNSNSGFMNIYVRPGPFRPFVWCMQNQQNLSAWGSIKFSAQNEEWVSVRIIICKLN